MVHHARYTVRCRDRQSLPGLLRPCAAGVDGSLERLCASYTLGKMKPYIHNPQVYRNHFGSGDTVFQGARRQRGYGAVKRFAVPLISKGKSLLHRL